MLIAGCKLSHLILKTALRGSVFIASLTGEDSMPREVRQCARGNTANEMSAHVSGLQSPRSVTAPAALLKFSGP